jgi:uncharacterized membrane protein HdeD (DUF308 family)
MQADAAIDFHRRWWVFLIFGVLWLMVSVVVLRFTERSITTVGIIVGVVFVIGACNEVLAAAAHMSWKWLHVVMAVLFGLGAIWAFAQPKKAFWALASVVGFLLVLKGAFDIALSAASRARGNLWWLGVTVGVLELGLGFWASQQLAPARAELILLWVGLLALFHGIGQIVFAFFMRHVDFEPAYA